MNWLQKRVYKQDLDQLNWFEPLFVSPPLKILRQDDLSHKNSS